MIPGDQQRLRECMTRTSLLDELLGMADKYAGADWFQRNAPPTSRCAIYRKVCRSASRRARYSASLPARRRSRPGSARHHSERIFASRAAAFARGVARSPGGSAARTSRAGTRICVGLRRSVRPNRDARAPSLGSRTLSNGLLSGRPSPRGEHESSVIEPDGLNVMASGLRGRSAPANVMSYRSPPASANSKCRSRHSRYRKQRPSRPSSAASPGSARSRGYLPMAAAARISARSSTRKVVDQQAVESG